MKISFCLTEKKEDSALDQRFGRCSWFMICDEEINNVEIIENTGKNDSNGAGTGAVQFLANHGVEAAVAPRLGPKAFQSFDALEIPVYEQGSCQNAREALALLKEKKLTAMVSPTAQGMHKA